MTTFTDPLDWTQTNVRRLNRRQTTPTFRVTLKQLNALADGFGLVATCYMFDRSFGRHVIPYGNEWSGDLTITDDRNTVYTVHRRYSGKRSVLLGRVVWFLYVWCSPQIAPEAKTLTVTMTDALLWLSGLQTDGTYTNADGVDVEKRLSLGDFAWSFPVNIPRWQRLLVDPLL